MKLQNQPLWRRTDEHIWLTGYIFCDRVSAKEAEYRECQFTLPPDDCIMHISHLQGAPSALGGALA